MILLYKNLLYGKLPFELNFLLGVKGQLEPVSLTLSGKFVLTDIVRHLLRKPPNIAFTEEPRPEPEGNVTSVKDLAFAADYITRTGAFSGYRIYA
ncbi:MAG: hypothetical protein IJY47_06900 [Clostridia bacterium]|nr:hypothetical protein [Clostridia bacterium]